ncbi:MAG: YceH family protein [Acidimicrobiales bacterium]|nr:YceH family protein [Acidimicrobiales bacterium]
MDLTAEDVRVLGCLIEKELTTPEQYPLTTNSLRLACNQKTNREPVVDYSDVDVDQAMLRLRQAGLARTVSSQGMRASKHKHVLGEAWGLDRRAQALLGALLVRGPQTAGELRTRTDRAAGFESLGEVESVLASLAARTPEALVVRLERRPGQKEERWAHLLCGDDIDVSHLDAPRPVRVVASGSSAGAGSGGLTVAELSRRVEALEGRLAGLTARFDALCEQLGVEPDSVTDAAPAG